MTQCNPQIIYLTCTMLDIYTHQGIIKYIVGIQNSIIQLNNI